MRGTGCRFQLLIYTGHSLAPSYGVFISQLVRYACVCSDVLDFNEQNLRITSKLLIQNFRYYKLEYKMMSRQ